MTRAIALLALLAACASPVESPVAEAPPELVLVAEPPACEVVLSPEAGLVASVEAGAARWSRATGCDVHVGEGGVPVVFATPILRPDGTEAPAATSEARDLVQVDPRHARRDEAVEHELGHVLGAGHVASHGVMSGDKGRTRTIDAASLEAVCAVLPCLAFMPEAP